MRATNTESPADGFEIADTQLMFGIARWKLGVKVLLKKQVTRYNVFLLCCGYVVSRLDLALMALYILLLETITINSCICSV